jgi:hypothetical protein
VPYQGTPDLFDSEELKELQSAGLKVNSTIRYTVSQIDAEAARRAES